MARSSGCVGKESRRFVGTYGSRFAFRVEANRRRAGRKCRCARLLGNRRRRRARPARAGPARSRRNPALQGPHVCNRPRATVGFQLSRLCASSVEGSRDAKTDATASIFPVGGPFRRRRPVAGHRSDKSRGVAPCTATQDAKPAIRAINRRTVGRGTHIAVDIAILHPLPCVPLHVVKTKGVRRKRAHRRRIKPAILARGQFGATLLCAIVCAIMAGFIAPGIDGRSSRPCCIFPFRFGREAIALSRPFAEPKGIGSGVVPANAHDGILVRLRKAEVAPGRFGRLVPGESRPFAARYDRSLGRPDESFPLPQSHVILRHGE